MNSATLKKKPNTGSIENEQKTLIIQLERQIRQKDKTIDLLQKLNKPQNECSETEEPLMVNGTFHPHNTSNTVKDSVNDTASNNIDNRMHQMEMNFCQNMNMITNCNMQMALQIQTLSNQLMMQSQQLLLQQQQQQFLNVNRIAGPQYIPAQVPNVLNHSHHGFNGVHPNAVHGPIYGQQLFYQRLFIIQPNVHMPLQRQLITQPVYQHQPTVHQQQPQQITPLSRQQLNNTSVKTTVLLDGVKNRATQVDNQHFQSETSSGCNIANKNENEMEMRSQTSPKAEKQNLISSHNSPKTEKQNLISSQNSPKTEKQNLISTHVSNLNDTSIETIELDSTGIVVESSASEPVTNVDSENELEIPTAVELTNQHVSDRFKLGGSSFLCIPSQKHIPPDTQDLHLEEKLI